MFGEVKVENIDTNNDQEAEKFTKPLSQMQFVHFENYICTPRILRKSSIGRTIRNVGI